MNIGIGIVTCNRPEFLEKLLDSIPTTMHKDIIIVNDGTTPIESNRGLGRSIHNVANLGVAQSKNLCFEWLLKMEYEHIFIIEDDMLIKNPDVFNEYIKASEITGLEHFMFAYHGPANKGNVSKGPPEPRMIIEYDGISISLNMHCVGSFCYYSRNCLKEVGIFDPNFNNAFDHVSHSYELAKAGFTTPYWNWADIANSYDFIDEQACSEESSSIKTPDRMVEWRENIEKSIAYFKKKHGVAPFGAECVPDTNGSDLGAFLKSKRP